MKSKGLRLALVAALTTGVVGLAAILSVMISHPIGFYDIATDSKGGLFGGSTSTVRFYGGKVLSVYSSSSLGFYTKSNDTWIWTTDTGHQVLIKPGILRMNCTPGDNPTNRFTARRTLPRKMGTLEEPAGYGPWSED